MTMWQHSAPSNQTTPTHRHNSRVEDSPSDPTFPVEETLESQVEYPQEMVEEVEEVAVEEAAEAFRRQHRHNKQLPTEEINSLAIRLSYSQEIAPNRKHL